MSTHTLHCSSIITNKRHHTFGTTPLLYPSQIRLAVRVGVHRPLCTSTKWNTPPTCLNKSRSSIVVTAGSSGYPRTTSTPKTSSKYQVSPSTTLPPTRPFTNFHPDVWGDGFLNRYIPEDNDDIKRAFKEAEIEQLKKRVTNELLAASAATAPLANKKHLLNLINHIQRLGLAYHFETEIEQTLQHVYETSLSSDDEDDLYTFSLRFRLLRQQGFDSSPGHRPLCTSTKWNTCLNKSRSSIIVTAGSSGCPWTSSTPKTLSKYQVSPRTQKSNHDLLNELQHDDDDQNVILPPTRPFTNFHPDVWGDGFLNHYIPEDNDDIKRAFKEAEIEQLKKRVTNELLATSAAIAPLANKKHLLNLINHIQRLGLAYHFETEIEQILQHVYETSLSSDDEDDLYTFSLRFRLLRQQGFDSSPG